MEARRQWDDMFNMLKGKTHQSIILYLANYASETDFKTLKLSSNDYLDEKKNKVGRFRIPNFKSCWRPTVISTL